MEFMHNWNFIRQEDLIRIEDYSGRIEVNLDMYSNLENLTHLNINEDLKKASLINLVLILIENSKT